MATKIIHDYPAAVAVDGAADYLLIDPASTGTYNKVNRNTLLGITSTPIGASDAQSLSNKTLDNTNTITVKDGNYTLQNSSDTTKQVKWSLSGITTGTTRTLTLPNRSDTLVTLAGTETLTNKTLTSPAITGGTIDNSAITVDSISGHTSAAQVTVGGVLMNNGVVSTANAVTATAIAAGAVQPQALVSGTGIGWSWSSWTPTWSNFTLGNGTQTAIYTQIGKLVALRINITFGSTTSMGSGPTFTLPKTSASTLVTNGQASCTHTGVTVVGGTVEIPTTLLGAPIYYVVAASQVQYAAISSTQPFTWQTGDGLSLMLFYEAA